MATGLVAAVWMVAAFVASAYAFNKGIHTIVDQTNEASSRIVDENFEWLLAACYVLYLTSSRVISGVWRLTGSRGLAVYLWDCICVPSITFLSLLAITPAKFQSGYISLLLHMAPATMAAVHKQRRAGHAVAHRAAGAAAFESLMFFFRHRHILDR